MARRRRSRISTWWSTIQFRSYRTSELFLKLFGLRSLADLPDPAQWDPSPEEEGELRDRLLRAGEARAGVGEQPS